MKSQDNSDFKTILTFNIWRKFAKVLLRRKWKQKSLVNIFTRTYVKKVFRTHAKKIRIYNYFNFVVTLHVIFQHLLDGKIQKINIRQYYSNFALCHISLLPWEGARKKMFSLWSAQDGWKHLIKHQMQVIIKFWKLALSMSSMKYVVDKLYSSFTLYS